MSDSGEVIIGKFKSFSKVPSSKTTKLSKSPPPIMCGVDPANSLSYGKECLLCLRLHCSFLDVSPFGEAANSIHVCYEAGLVLKDEDIFYVPSSSSICPSGLQPLFK